MHMDPVTAAGVTIPEQHFHWDDTDSRRYRHAVGQSDRQAGMLPTFALTAPGAFGVASPDFYHPEPPEVRFPGIRLNLATLLQQSQQLRVHAPIPESGTARCRGEVLRIENRGTAAVLVQRTELVAEDGRTLVSGISRIHARGAGRPAAPAVRRTAPEADESAPAIEIVVRTDEQQAQWYQACGKNTSLRNNVHTDAAFASAAGLAGPIMQGVCTYAMVCAALVDAVLDAEVSRVREYTARFTGMVFPGESLHTRIWPDAFGYRFRTSVPERADAPVLLGELRTD
ncbi:MaoC/PaaZ C-terminal domain-containing protein [Nocardia cyriacigeorgica]|uniref:MaoC/PaaZ C-terminal domain-containing protein n=1 Tax=Nocardia cyriacigeorgica TaxID=135487 RepID=UPI002454A456|nr:MaoC/PaaZ C-terminal domain-containing protein [Nocardia cyriacigeorgica]